MNVSTYNDLFVEKLYLNGVEFSVDNFKGEPGETPTVDPDANDYKGDNGVDWSLRYKTIDISENDVGILTLPDPTTGDYTAIQIVKSITTTGDITVMSHDNRFIGRMYAPHTQTIHLFRSLDDIWIK